MEGASKKKISLCSAVAPKALFSLQGIGHADRSDKKVRTPRVMSRDLYAQILLLTIHKSLQLWTRTSYAILLDPARRRIRASQTVAS